MACMTHYCGECEVEYFNNLASMHCPTCGEKCTSWFDEWPEGPDLDEEEEEDESSNSSDGTKQE